MASKLIFVDAGVLIAAVRGSNQVAQQAMAVLDDPDAEFASSIFVRLEVLPKSVYNKHYDEASFYEACFNRVDTWASSDEDLVRGAYDEAVYSGLSAMDALHVVAAASLEADELVTSEKTNRPIHRTELFPVRSITPQSVS